MKKLFIGMVAALCCLAMAAPVLAEVKMGGMISMELSYNSISEEAQAWGAGATPGAGGAPAGAVQKSPVAATTALNGFEETNFVLPATKNRFGMEFISEDKKVGGYIELRGGGTTNALAGSSFEWTYGYIDWRPIPGWLLRIGKQTTTFSPYVPNQWIGTHLTTILGVGFGNVNHTTSRTGIKSNYKISDMIAFEVSIWDNHINNQAGGLQLAPQGIAGAALRGTATGVESTIPRIDVSLPIKIGNIKIEPSATWSTIEYDQLQAGDDDNYDIWGVSLGGVATFGPFTLTAEITYGENLGSGSYRGGETAPVFLYLDPAGFNKFADSEILAGFIDLTFKLNPMLGLSVFFGAQNSQGDGDPNVSWDAGEFDYTRWMAGVGLPISVTKNFIILPEFTYYDYDSSAEFGVAGTKTEFDLGNEWLMGLEFRLTF